MKKRIHHFFVTRRKIISCIFIQEQDNNFIFSPHNIQNRTSAHKYLFFHSNQSLLLPPGPRATIGIVLSSPTFCWVGNNSVEFVSHTNSTCSNIFSWSSACLFRQKLTTEAGSSTYKGERWFILATATNKGFVHFAF